MGARVDAAATLNAVAASGTAFFLHLGDMSYDEIRPESAWCDFVKAKVGATFAYELVAGEHDSAGRFASPGERIERFAACLPDRLHSQGTYGNRYFFDYPARAPLARIVTISPGLTFAGHKGVESYARGSPNYTWVGNVIDDARARRIPWVIVAMAMDCITAGLKRCEIGTDLLNLLVSKKVDLILQAHEHGYERSRQLAVGPACPVVPVGSYSACVVHDGASDRYAKGAGPVIVIAGTAGVPLRPMNRRDPEARYFVKLMGSNLVPTRGFVKYTVSATRLHVQFVRSAGGDFTDAFTIDPP